MEILMILRACTDETVNGMVEKNISFMILILQVIYERHQER